MNVLLKKRISRYLATIATVTFMTACTTTAIAPEDVPPALFSELDAGSDFYLNQDKQLGSDENLVWQFLSVQALIKERKFVLADAVIESLKTSQLSAQQSATLNLLIADNFYAQNKLLETQTALTATDYQALSQQEFVHFLKLQAELHIRNELPLAATDSLLVLAPLLSEDEEKQSYNDLLLAQLTLLTREQLTQYQTVATEQPDAEEPLPATETVEETLEVITPPVQDKLAIDQNFKEGWYSLAALYQANKLRPNRLTRTLNDWKETYSDHAALPFLPLVLKDIAAFSPYQPDNIAVLLPLSGRFEKQGKAIQLGLLNAYYQQLNDENEDVDKVDEQLNTPKLHFFDTQIVDSKQLASQLKQSNIDFVIGPLMKNEIDGLLPLIEDMPVLALNSFAQAVAIDIETMQNIEAIQWHYAFPLSPEDEAKQAASMIFSNQHKNPIIIAPDSGYGKRVAEAFKTQWATLTPESDLKIEAHYFQSKAKLNTFIDEVLQTGKSKRRISQMQAIAKVPLETEVRSRRDVDAIYIVSKRDELILLKPFIDVSVSPFANKIPLYASSRSHSFDRNNMQNRELSRLVFSDNPFLLGKYDTLSKEVQQAWKRQSFSSLRLFALGYDSYQLIEQLVYLQNSDDAVYKGLIGDLRLSADNSIEAQLSWAKYLDGELFEVASPVTTE